MIDYDDEILQDFLSRMDDLDQEVQAGLALMKSGQLQTGIDTVLRPVHTIKGTAGFIGGLEKLQAAAHQTEDHLREAQSGRLEPTPETVDLLVRAVDVVFEMIEQTKNRPPELDDAEAQKILSRLGGDDGRVPSPTQEDPVFLAHSASGVVKEQAGQDDQVGREEKDGVVILRVKTPRIHLPSHYQDLTEQLQKIGPQEVAALDLSGVRTISSTAWGEIWKARTEKRLVLIGMQAAVEATFTTWNLDRYFERFATEAEFWQQFEE